MPDCVIIVILFFQIRHWTTRRLLVTNTHSKKFYSMKLKVWI